MSNKAIFLDRDGTLIEDPGYLNHPDQVFLLDGVAEALIELRDMGYKLIVVSNQSAVARGIITEKILGEIHDRLRQLLAEKGAYLDEIYYCPYHPDGVVPKYSKESELRKPNPGMLLAAADDMKIDLSQSWSIGDSSRDIEAGLRAGCHTILLTYHSRYKTSYDGPIETKPDYKSVNMKEAVNIIKKYHRTSSGEKVPTRPTPEYKPQPAPEPEFEPVQKPKTRRALKIKKKMLSQTTQKPSQQQENHVEQETQPVGTEQMLNSILGQLKSMQRENMFGEFSIMRFVAGVIQIIVPFCLLITVWLLMRPERQDSLVSISLGFAIVLQMMSLTFYIMTGRR
jgi:D-glycero-D-manno-heptose 1,7-bisphosphate phosphatase